ncbi:MAG TPA: extracellular solute-binding protein, partial [Microbacterium sp.]|nr:extracellular solute-binding protein [Microbacterium sp.]
MKSKILAGVGVAAVAAAALTGCSSSGGSSAEASCTNKIVNEDATQVSVWAWYPAFEDVVDEFNNTHDDVQICWTNAGQGNDEYTKFSTAIESGSGAPDVIMLEAEVLSSFSIRDALVDLSEYGAADVKDDYTEGAWKDVSSGDSVYAIPVDGGPMGMLYRKDILDQYGIAAPTTWQEFGDAAQKLQDAGAPGVLANFPPNG